MFKRSFSLILSAIFVISIFSTAYFNATAQTDGDWEYRISDGNVIITSYNGTVANLIIPSSFDGISVTEIGTSAFYGNTSLQGVQIPNTIEIIGLNAFAYCTSLWQVQFAPQGVLKQIESNAFIGCSALNKFIFPETVLSIGSHAFADCLALEGIILPDNITELSSGIFFNCEKLTSVTLGSKLTKIGVNSFTNCGLISVTIPDNVTLIGESAFRENENLRQVTLNNGLKTLSQYTFYGCNSLESINIPNSVTELGYYAFYGCSSLETAVLGNGIEKILAAFYDCNNLTNITFGSGLIEIGDFSFWNCNLISVTIPNKVTSIGVSAFQKNENLQHIAFNDGLVTINDNAFSGCSALKSLNIPSSVSVLGDYVFDGCTSLENAILGNGIKTLRGTFNDCENLTSIILGNGLSEIGYQSFTNCNLTTVTLPTKVTAIGYYAFQNNEALSSVYFTGNAPDSFDSSVFNNTSEDLKLYYVNDKTGWSNPWNEFSTEIFVPIKVTFDENGIFALCPPDQYFSPLGGKIIIPVNPASSTHRFIGWSTDAACTQAWDFNDTVTVNTILYAKWAELPPVPTNIIPSTKTEDTISIIWDIVEEAQSYNIYVNGELYNAEPVLSNSYTIEGLEPDTDYKITITVVNESGESLLSDEISITTAPKGGSSRLKGLILNNGNNADISISDAIAIFRHLADKVLITDEDDVWAADIDNKGGITIQDAIYIFRYLADKITFDELQNIT